MSLYLDVKYLNMISHRFEIFKRKDDYLFNVRCPVCGDSAKNKRKMRGYFYRKQNDMFYKCHNCSHGASFGNMLKMLDQNAYKEYVLERYKDGVSKFKPHKDPEFPDFVPDFDKSKHKFVPDFDNKEKPPFKKSSPARMIDRIMDRVDNLPYDHEAVKYCEERKIPKHAFDRLYYIDNVQDVIQLNDKYRESIKTKEPRLAIPFFDHRGHLMSVTLRAMRGETLRYILVKVNEKAPTVFGLDEVDVSEPILVVEGPIDSLFLENAIAVSGTSFSKIDELDLPQEQMTIAFDNQPKNSEVCKLMKKYIDLNYSICIWPNDIEGKDINDMIMSGLSESEVVEIINRNTVKGLSAKLQLMEYKKT